MTLKKSDMGSNTNWAAPDGEKLKDKYEFAWDIYAILQKWCDQSISADFYKKVALEKISSEELISEYLYMVKMGMKTRYYYNSMTSKKLKMDEVPEDALCDDAVKNLEKIVEVDWQPEAGDCEGGFCTL